MIGGGLDRKALITQIRGEVCTQTDPADRLNCKQDLKARFDKECPEGAADEAACAAKFKVLLNGGIQLPHKESSDLVFDTLIAFLDHPKMQVRMNALSALGGRVVGIMPKLVKMMVEGKYGIDYDERLFAALAVNFNHNISATANALKPHAATLKKLLEDERSEGYAIFFLLKIDPKNAETISTPKLGKLLQNLLSSSEPDRLKINAIVTVAYALAAKRTPDAIPFLESALNHRDWRVRYNTLHPLESMGAKAAPALPKLQEMSKQDDDLGVQKEVKKTIVQIEEAVQAEKNHTREQP